MLKDLKTACDFLATIDTINRGGCLIAAMTVYLYMDRPKEFQFVCLNSRGCVEGIRDNQRVIDYIFDPNTKPAGASYHIGWSFDGLISIYDTDGRIKEDDKDYFIVGIPRELTERFFYKAIRAWNWNNSFDRTKHIRYIEKNLLIDFGIPYTNVAKISPDGELISYIKPFTDWRVLGLGESYG